MVRGDNLGLNTIFNMMASFNSDYCCQICRASKEKMHKMVVKDEKLLRNEKNYETNVKESDVSKTRIYKSTIFN